MYELKDRSKKLNKFSKYILAQNSFLLNMQKKEFKKI